MAAANGADCQLNERTIQKESHDKTTAVATSIDISSEEGFTSVKMDKTLINDSPSNEDTNDSSSEPLLISSSDAQDVSSNTGKPVLSNVTLLPHNDTKTEPNSTQKKPSRNIESMVKDKELPSLELEPGTDINIKYDNPADRDLKNQDPNIPACRAELRERFLWTMTGLTGHHMEVTMMEQLGVSGTLRGMDKDGLMVHVEGLTTPTAVHPWATLRLPDCLALTFPLG